MSELSIFVPISIELFKRIDKSKLKKMTVTLSEVDNIDIDGELLTELSIYVERNPFEEISPIERMLLQHKKVRFLECGNLRKIELKHMNGFDISDVAALQKLENLNLSYTYVNDFSWIRNCRALKNLILQATDYPDLDLPIDEGIKEVHVWSCELASIDGIKIPNSLEILDISRNNIQKISYPEKLMNLKQINLYKNPITQLGRIAQLEGIEQILTEKDYVTAKYESDFLMLANRSYKTTRYQLEHLDQYPSFIRRRYENNSEMDLFIKNVISNFEEEFYRINPENTWIREYSVAYKKSWMSILCINGCIAVFVIKDA